MAIRANQLTNFKGEAYATTKQVETKINELSSSVAAEIKEVSDSVNQIKTEVTDGLIDKSTGNLNAKYNPIKVLSTENKEGYKAQVLKNDQGEVINPEYYRDNDYSKIQFIGDCKVTYRTDGQIVIRIGENLNSSTFNTNDGQTNGSASFSDNNETYPADRKVNGFDASKSVWLKGTNDVITITTAQKIHFDDAENTEFTIAVTANGETYEYKSGKITKNGTYGSAPCVLTITNWQQESKTTEGATGYEANISIAITLSSIVTKAGDVSFKITSTGTEGAKSFEKSVAYFIVDTTTMPAVSDFTAKLTSESTAEYAGITYITSGTVTYEGTVANLNKPATNASDGASINFSNTGAYAAGVDTKSTTTYDGIIKKTGSLTVPTTGNPKKYSTEFVDGVKFTAYNINGSASATASLQDSNGKAISKMIVLNKEVNSSLLGTGNRRTIDGTAAYTDANAPGADDLMVYGGVLQYPQAFIDNTYYQNSTYQAPSASTFQDGSKAAVFKFAASGTENSCTLTIEGEKLTDAQVKSITFGNSMDNLKSLSGYTDNGSTSTASKLVYKFAYKTDADKATTNTGVYLKVVFTGTNPKITKITKGL